MSECTHDCSSCGESCADRQGGSPFQIKPLHEGCHVRKVYGVVSGKGGVGKSMVTSQLAVTMQRRGHRTAILDADVTGPSIPKCFGIHGRAVGSEDAILPVQTETGIQLMSVNLLLEHETDPVIWRGPVIGGVVQQFCTDRGSSDFAAGGKSIRKLIAFFSLRRYHIFRKAVFAQRNVR